MGERRAPAQQAAGPRPSGGWAPAGRQFNLTQLLVDAIPRRWDALPALCSRDGCWNYAQLRQHVGAAAGSLARRGVRPGSYVILGIPDSREWVALFLGAIRLGATCAGTSPTMAPAIRDELLGRLPAPITIDDPDEARATIAGGAADPGPAATRADDSCYMLLTSGSTGPSKWVVHRQRDIAACIATYGRRILRLGPGDVTASVAALPTSYGLGNSLYFPLSVGACAWIDPQTATPDGMLDAVTRRGVTAAFGVPTSWARLQRQLAGTPDAGMLRTLRLAASAGEALPVATWEAVHDTTGLRLLNSLGSSEATNFYLSDRPGRPRAGTVGWPVPGFRVRVIAADGRDAEPGCEGEAWAQGASVTPGYLGDPQATARTLVDGWLRTGDRVVREPDGSHTFIGRIGDRFKAGAFWIDPIRIQEALLQLEMVGQAVVVGVEDEVGLTRVAAVATPAGVGATTVRLREALAGILAPHEIPQAVAWVPELPTTPNGKVRRDEVRRLASEAIIHHHRQKATQ